MNTKLFQPAVVGLLSASAFAFALSGILTSNPQSQPPVGTSRFPGLEGSREGGRLQSPVSPKQYLDGYHYAINEMQDEFQAEGTTTSSVDGWMGTGPAFILVVENGCLSGIQYHGRVRCLYFHDEVD